MTDIVVDLNNQNNEDDVKWGNDIVLTIIDDGKPHKELVDMIVKEDIQNEEWYQALIEELKACIIETEFISRWSLIEGYHKVGSEILAHESQFTQAGYLKASETIAQSLGKSQRQIEQCIQFARKYPDLSLFQSGKNVSWHKITQELLPEHTESTTKPLTKADLIQMLKEIKLLLQHEFEDTIKDHLDNIPNVITGKAEYIRYLQDQIDKITIGVE
jgi:hypothetical protein